MSFIERREQKDPLALIKAIASQNGWTLEGAGDQVALLVRGKVSTDYRVSFTWMRSLELFHLACSLELQVPELRRSEVAAINQPH